MNANMNSNTQVFIPVSDDIIYNHPEKIEGPLIPYAGSEECQSWLSIEINPDESVPLAEPTAKTSHRKAAKHNLRLAYSA